MASKRVSPQIKVSVPPSEMPAVKEAMKFDGVTNLSAFVLAALRQRTQKVLREKARTLEAEKST